MRRFSLIGVLIPAVLLATVGLAYYAYSYDRRTTAEVRTAAQETRRELGKEKVLGIQDRLIGFDEQFFTRISQDNFSQLQIILEESPHASVFILDLRSEIVPGGFYTERPPEEWEDLRELFLTQVLPDLRLDSLPFGELSHVHNYYSGRPYLWSYKSMFIKGKIYFVVAEFDLSYLLAEIFPQYFDVRGPNLYQVLDADGNNIFGLAGVPVAGAVELDFPRTLRRWRLRIAQKDAASLVSKQARQKNLDLFLIGLAVLVNVFGLTIMWAAVRRERRLNQLKSDFISNVSHELKTPLSIISMFGELLSMGRTKSSEQAVEYAEIIHRESVRLSRLIDNVLDFAKIERGADAYDFKDDISLEEVVRRVLEISRPRLERAKVTVECETRGEIPALRLDEGAMTLAILNLVDNAIKYAADGKAIEISMSGRNRGVELQVRDFGPGIPEDERSSVFERFYRSKDVRLKPIRGSGIGLALVKHIVEAHGGRIEVAPDVSPGAAFRMWIPAGRGG